ncbi:Transcription factor [Aspergillus sp. HF37]|nr:Transcription factor [Aspergillus sp. HF37]
MSVPQSQTDSLPLAVPPPPPPDHNPPSGTDNARIPIPPAPASTRPPYPHIRSCLSCRQRKVKCDRQNPCSNCDRTGSECIFPPGPGRAPKRPRGARDPRLLERLWKLEGIVCRLGAELDSDDEDPKGDTGNNDKPGTVSQRESQTNPTIEQEFGRLLIDETRSCYVGNRLWASLGDEVSFLSHTVLVHAHFARQIEELRDLLHQPWSGGDEYNSWQSSFLDQPHPGTEVSLFGYSALAHSLRIFHPPFSQLVLLLDHFKENVAPLVRIFHMPSMIQMFWTSIAALDSLDKNTEALMFAIYYAAIISLSPEQCESQLGERRPAALAKYRFVVEQALARANLLNTQSVVLIQAAVLFLSALRNEDDSRTVWSMTALTFHLAQTIGLHRDGTAFGLKPFETEIRRRIWWHICLLDARSSEDHGCEPIVHDAVFDTKLPMNVNDVDLFPEMAEFPEEKEGATEMTFCLIRCQVTRTMRRIGYVPPSTRGSGRHQDGPSSESRPKLMGELQRLLEQRYLRYCNPSIPIFLASATVTRLIIARMWLAVHHPMSHKDPLPSNIRDRLFLASVEVIELSALLLTDQNLLKWNWYFKTHIQWHAVAFVLSEICSRPPSPDCDRAWNYVIAVYDRLDTKDKDRKGNLGRPIHRLMAKARQVREIQRANASALEASHNSASTALTDAPGMSYLPSESYPIPPVAAPDGAASSSADTPMELPPDPLFGLNSLVWDLGAPAGPADNMQPLIFDPGIFPSTPPGPDSLS